MKKSKLLLGLSAIVSGIVLGSGCFSSFSTGLLRRGFVNNKTLDIITDWLNEDLFG
jgi:hypothetical protein